MMFLCPAAALAQTTSEPGHIDERFRPQPEKPTVGAPIDIPATPRTTAPKGSEGVHFKLKSVEFTGNSVLSDSVLQQMASSYVGREVTLAEVYALADSVTAEYRSRGYILVRAIPPAQRITDGHLKIRVIEGFIANVKIQGDAGGARPYLEAYGRRIQKIAPLTADVLERELLLASDLTGLRLRSVLTPSSVTGGADLTFVVDPKPVDAYLYFDNRGSKYLGPYELMAGIFANDAFGTGGRLGLNAVMTPNAGPELGYGAISYDQPLGENGLKLFSSFSVTRTRPGSVLKLLGTKGRALNWDGTLSYPITRSRDLNIIVSGGFAYKDVRSSNIAANPLFSDHVRSLNAALFINTLDNWGGYSTASATITKGLGIFGATRSSSPNKSRFFADGSYWRGNIELTHEQPIGNQVSLFLAAAGQTSFGGSLLASEQFSLGGTGYDRGFDPSEVTGDSALAGRAELRWTAVAEAGLISNVQLYGFYEGGKVWQDRVLPGSLKSESLFSAGAGVRFQLADNFHANVEWAKPLNRDVAAKGNRDSRVFFSVGVNL
ncbi:MAG TPA: ShlB/FhaC/HecB family hemolysin secretion/activation protein [Rhizomicrobium sp.]|nr:ShlB/FhaC/HecB family hemolysin secretion/activation protein [Rhizomicrobium sp.]